MDKFLDRCKLSNLSEKDKENHSTYKTRGLICNLKKIIITNKTFHKETYRLRWINEGNLTKVHSKINNFNKLFWKIENEVTIPDSFWGQYYSDTKTRQGYHKEIN